MKQIILPSTVLEFTWLVIYGFMEENGLAPFPKKEIRSPQYRRSPRNLKSSQPLATRHKKKLAPHKKNICGWGKGGVYTMENKDTNTEYQKFVRVLDQKCEIVELNSESFFCLRFLFTIFFYREFSSPTRKKSPPPKVPIPTQNLNLT